jgi:hypothetical protein
VRAVQRPADASRSSHPIDRFIFSELKKRGLRPIHEHGVIEDSRRTYCASDVFGNVVRDVVV